MVVTREQLAKNAANAFKSGAPVQIFGARGAGKGWVLRRALALAGLSRVTPIPFDLDAWVDQAEAKVLAEMESTLVGSAPSASLLPADDGRSSDVPLESLLSGSSEPVVLVVNSSLPYYTARAGRAVHAKLERWSRRSANRQPPWDRLRLVTVTHTPFAVASLIQNYDPYALGRTQLVECGPITESDCVKVIKDTPAQSLWSSRQLDYINTHAAAGHPLILRRLAEVATSRDPVQIVASASDVEGPIGHFFKQMRAAVEQRPGGVELLRRMVHAQGVVPADLAERAFLASWAVCAWRGPLNSFKQGVPATVGYVQSTFRR